MRLILLLILGCVFLGAAEGQPVSGRLPGAGGQAGFDPPGANDHIFPPIIRAKPFIDFDAKGFLVGGKRTFLVSAGLEYARVPHELWEDRLLRLRQAGFNCVEIYTFWNFHEPREGQFDFSGDHDLEAFLRLVRKLGLYAIVRVGPYYCAEWDNGGYPLWLRFKPGVRVREDNAEFEKYVDRYFDKLLPIVKRQQIHLGGAVILVQLENEHPKGWGTVVPDGYFSHLLYKALSMGLEVPYFFSGLHHATDPAGESASVKTAASPGAETGKRLIGQDAASLDDSSRPNPWMSTEFWSVWYSGYGSTVKDAREYERRTWKIIAHGGNGYNYYMAYGGTNFGYTNNDEDAASYDYGAAVGQAGDLRPIYYSFKRMGWWARSFENILENSVDGTEEWRRAVKVLDIDKKGPAVNTDTAVTVTARHSPAGDVLFLDNRSTKPASVLLTQVQQKRVSTGNSFPEGEKLPVGGPLSLAPGEIVPVIHHFVLDSLVTLEWAPVRILGTSRQSTTATMVIYGEAGSPAELYFSVQGKANVEKGGTGLLVKEGSVVLQAKFSEARTPAEYVFSIGGKKWRILTVNSRLVDCTWLVESAGKSYVVCGPDYVEDVRMQNGKVVMTAESRWDDSVRYPVWVYGKKASLLHGKMQAGSTGPMKLSLTPWQFRKGAAPAGRGYYDHDWKYSQQPLQMGADGDLTADAWYRTTVYTDTAGLYTLQVEGSDRATAFVDGVPAGTGAIRDGEITFTLSKGRHTLAFFVAHDGRDKLAAYLGTMDSVDRKGLFGKAMLRKGGASIVTLGGWKFLKARDASEGAREEGAAGPGAGTFPATGTAMAAGWKDYTIGEDAFGQKEGFGWFRTILAEPEAGVAQIVLNFKSVDENATVFINGRKIGRHAGWNQPFDVVIGGLDTLRRPLELTVFMENYSNEGGIDKPVRANYTGPGKEVTGWRMRGGPGSIGVEGWKKLAGVAVGKAADENRTMLDTAITAMTAGPCFYRTTFVTPAYGASGVHPIWRVHTEGLGHGSVWVNGHNLGRYPEKTAAPGLYIPECWLKPGGNSLIIFEEDGKAPGQVSVQAEKAASRDRMVFSNF